MTTADVTDTTPGWLSVGELGEVRDRVPLVYVEAVPVRLDHLGRIVRVGLLLRPVPDGTVSRAVVSGRVLLGETVREALWRHLNKDLGPQSDPQVPASPVPITVAEYFPDRRRTGFVDPRQHAVALAYLVPVTGTCEPAQDALEFSWMTPEEVTSSEVAAEMSSGHDRLVRIALAHAQRLP
ncbi:MAG: NUDIX hydrolase family protein [Actinomycetota bacterium]|nr:NUDIX hydrolase family protein [Actinomycetota bacterium]